MSEKLFNLNGKVALVTGAGGHLGQSMAMGLARAGAFVYLAGRNAARLEAVREEILAAGGKAESLPVDVREREAIEAAMERIKHESGRLDILINNAYAGGSGSLAHSRKSQFLASYDIAVASAAELIQLALPLLDAAAGKEEAGASIINIASMYGMVSPDPGLYDTPEAANPPFYGAAKAALIQLTRSLACEFGKRGIRVNSISPGPFPSLEVQSDHPGFVQRLADKLPMGRVGESQEIVGPVLFLASDAASFVTGANLVVDGGWTAW